MNSPHHPSFMLFTTAVLEALESRELGGGNPLVKNYP